MSQAHKASKINAKRPLNKNFKANIYWEGKKWMKRVNVKTSQNVARNQCHLNKTRKTAKSKEKIILKQKNIF